MLVRICNCCGKEIKSDEFYYSLKVIECNDDKNQSSLYPIEDLCDECNTMLSKYYGGMKLRKVRFIHNETD